MGLPSVIIAFQTTAAAAVARSKKGTVALIVKDAKANGAHSLTAASQIPKELGEANRKYVARAFTGYVTPPRRVLLYVLPAEAAELTEGLDWLATQVFDYLAGPPDLEAAQATAIASWIKSRRANEDAVCKAVLPDCAADSEAVVNLTTQDIQAEGAVYTPAEYCSRIAGLLAGTPMTISCTFAPMPEVSDVKRLTREAMDAAIDAGQFILIHDGLKVKAAQGVNSLVTTTASKGAAFRKIKLVEAMDMIQADIRNTAQDSWIGKYPNSYDSKCLLVTAIKGYLTTLENEGVLQAGSSTVAIDVEGQEAWLQSQGTDTSAMSEQQIKEANTADQVFLSVGVKILDAIEYIRINITL